MSNVTHKITKEPLAHGIEFLILNHKGLKVGIIGLAEEEWLDLLSYSEEVIQFEDFVSCAKRYIKKFKEEDHCDLIIALTHMRTVSYIFPAELLKAKRIRPPKPNDEKLARETVGIDLILGGHDHIVLEKEVNKTLIIKSGTNFMQFRILRVFLNGQEDARGAKEDESYYKLRNISVSTKLVQVTTDFPPKKELVDYVDYYMKDLVVKKAQVTCMIYYFHKEGSKVVVSSTLVPFFLLLKGQQLSKTDFFNVNHEGLSIFRRAGCARLFEQCERASSAEAPKMREGCQIMKCC